MKNKYPQLVVELSKLKSNCRQVVGRCEAMGVRVTGVIKGCNGLMPVVKGLKASGLYSFGSSRISHLANIGHSIPTVERWLLRIPMLSEIDEVVRHATVSLQSERTTLEALQNAASKNGLTHKVVLMIDLGDLREGVWGVEALVKLAKFVEDDCENIELFGIGTNLGCYGSIKPNLDNMSQLVDAKDAVELAIGRALQVVSGGATSTYPMVLDGSLPKGINHLRIGEGILLSRDLKLFFGLEEQLSDMHCDTFTLQAQVVEIQTKPSYPVGEIFVDAFGNRPQYTNLGLRKRAILAVGKQDYGDHTKLISCLKGVELVGSSSDHLIADITDVPYDAQIVVGSIMSFELLYPAMLYLSIDRDVAKVYQD